MKNINMMYAFDDTRKVSDNIWAYPNYLPDAYKIDNPIKANDEMYCFQKYDSETLVTRVFLDTEFFTYPCYRKQTFLLSSVKDLELKRYLESLMN